jgi:hypothetical protein
LPYQEPNIIFHANQIINCTCLFPVHDHNLVTFIGLVSCDCNIPQSYICFIGSTVEFIILVFVTAFKLVNINNANIRCRIMPKPPVYNLSLLSYFGKIRIHLNNTW